MTKDENEIDQTETSESPETETQEQSPSPGAAGVPKRIGQYRIKRAIASGGMGTVYEALQEKPRRTVAVKLMRAGIASRSALRRFEYESQLLARLRHPGIAQVYDAGTHRDGEVRPRFPNIRRFSQTSDNHHRAMSHGCTSGPDVAVSFRISYRVRGAPARQPQVGWFCPTQAIPGSSRSSSHSNSEQFS